MSINVSSVTLSGAVLDGENPLPCFCDPVQNRPLSHDNISCAFKYSERSEHE